MDKARNDICENICENIGCARTNLDFVNLAYSAFVVSLFLSVILMPAVESKSKYSIDSPLTIEQQKALKRGVAYAKKGSREKASPIFNAVIAECHDLPKCMSVAEYTEQFGYPLVDVRRSLMNRALELCRTREDYILVALKSRQYECYDVTRHAIQQLIAQAKTPDDLTDLARKAQEVALNDVAHLAMEKAFTTVKTVPEALEYAKQVHALGMEEQLRKVIKELIDDEPNASRLCTLLRKIEPYDLKELNRYLLKKALTQSQTVQEFADVWEAANRHRQKDISEVAAYRGKKLKIIQQIKGDQAAHSQKVQEWRQNQSRQMDSNQGRVESELSRQGASPSGF